MFNQFRVSTTLLFLFFIFFLLPACTVTTTEAGVIPTSVSHPELPAPERDIAYESQPALMPEISLQPKTGRPGMQFVVNGTGFPPSTVMSLHLGPPNVGYTWENYGGALTDAQGNVSLVFQMPQNWSNGTAVTEPEIVVVLADEQGQNKAMAAVNLSAALQPSLLISPAAASVGQSVELIGQGFAPNVSVAIRLGVPKTGLSGEDLLTLSADAQGSFNTDLTLPTLWPGTDAAIVEPDVIVAAVDTAVNQTIATANLRNEPSVFAEEFSRTGICDESVLSVNEALALVMGGSLNVRTGPGVGYPIRTTVNQCQGMSLVGRSSNSQWVQVRLPGGYEGWVNASYIKANVTVSSLVMSDNPPPAPTAVPTPESTEIPGPVREPLGTVITSQVDVREQPSNGAALVTVIQKDQGMSLLGRTEDSSWVHVQLPGGYKGWLPASAITANVQLGNLPVTAVAQSIEAIGTLVFSQANVYQSASSSAAIVTTITDGQAMSLLGRTDDHQWIYVQLPGGYQGWIEVGMLQTGFNITNLPVKN